MKRLAIIMFFVAATASAESRLHKWTRRALAAGACAASALDGYDSATRLDGRSFREGNPLLRNSNGSANITRLVSFKIGACAAPLLIGEFAPSDAARKRALVGAAAAFGMFAATDVHNRLLFGRTQQQSHKRKDMDQ